MLDTFCYLKNFCCCCCFSEIKKSRNLVFMNYFHILSDVISLFTHVTFNYLQNDKQSSILSPPCLYSLISKFLSILSLLPFQKNLYNSVLNCLKNKLSGLGSNK